MKIITVGKQGEPKFILRSKSDLLALLLKVFKWFFSEPDWLKGYNFDYDIEHTKVYIYDIFSEHQENLYNKFPAIILGISGSYVQPLGLGHSFIHKEVGREVINLKYDVHISITIIGRNKLETYKLAEFLENILYIVKPDIEETVLNLENITNISIGDVQPYRQGDDIRYFTTQLGFQASFTLEFEKKYNGNLFLYVLSKMAEKAKENEEQTPILNEIIIKDYNDQE